MFKPPPCEITSVPGVSSPFKFIFIVKICFLVVALTEGPQTSSSMTSSPDLTARAQFQAATVLHLR